MGGIIIGESGLSNKIFVYPPPQNTNTFSLPCIPFPLIIGQSPVIARVRIVGQPRRAEGTVEIVGHPPVQPFNRLDPWSVKSAVEIDGHGAHYRGG